MSFYLNSFSGFILGKLVNPTPKSLFNQTQLNRKEALYASHQRAPLGQVRDTSKTLPHNLDKVEFVFGLASEKGKSVFMQFTVTVQYMCTIL